MFLKFIVEGAVIGFLASAPVGPVSILIIQRTVSKSRLAGFFSGAGAAFSDTFYASVAGFGLTFFVGFIHEKELFFQIAGSVVLVAMGLFIFFTHPGKSIQKSERKRYGYLQYTFTTFLLTVSNPLILLLYFGIFTGCGVVPDMNHPFHAVFILLGFWLGALTWWFLLTGLVSFFRKKFSVQMLVRFNKLSGAAIIAIVLVSFILSVAGEVCF